jgi:hypothetical protein
MWYNKSMNKGVNVKLSVGDISHTGKEVVSWNYQNQRHKKYTMRCIKCGYECETSIKSFYNTCKSCSVVRVNTTTKERQLWNRYKNSALRNGVPFLITEDKFSEIIKKDCLYCGQEPSQTIIMGRKQDNVLIYNGVDRRNDKLGYVEGNVSPCCWTCNQAKKNYGVDEFKKMIKKWSSRVDQW